MWGRHELVPCHLHTELPLLSPYSTFCFYKFRRNFIREKFFPSLIMPVLIALATELFTRLLHITVIFCSIDSWCQRTKEVCVHVTIYSWHFTVALIFSLVFCMFGNMSAQLEPGRILCRFLSDMFIAWPCFCWPCGRIFPKYNTSSNTRR